MKVYAAVVLIYSMMIMNALYTMPPTIERGVTNCEGYAVLHINCERPFMAQITPPVPSPQEITESAAYAMAKAAHCVIPTRKTVLFRLRHKGTTYDWCIFFKESETVVYTHDFNQEEK